jgi:hypothetical protein
MHNTTCTQSPRSRIQIKTGVYLSQNTSFAKCSKREIYFIAAVVSLPFSAEDFQMQIKVARPLLF